MGERVHKQTVSGHFGDKIDVDLSPILPLFVILFTLVSADKG